jgi:hypothetical protein
MPDRRPLIEGLKPPAAVLDPKLEKAFVYGTKEKPKTEEPMVDKPSEKSLARAPVTTRIRADFATALKRASLERQLAGTTPNTLQEILEEALEPWLKTHGYVRD